MNPTVELAKLLRLQSQLKLKKAGIDAGLIGLGVVKQQLKLKALKSK